MPCAVETTSAAGLILHHLRRRLDRLDTGGMPEPVQFIELCGTRPSAAEPGAADEPSATAPSVPTLIVRLPMMDASLRQVPCRRRPIQHPTLVTVSFLSVDIRSRRLDEAAAFLFVAF